MMQMIPIRGSSLVNGIGYDLTRMTLLLRFVSGRHKDYPAVPVTLWQQFMEAPSKGKFFNSRIRGQKYRKAA